MRRIDSERELTRLLTPPADVSRPGASQPLAVVHPGDCRACREAEAEIVELLARFRGAAPPPLAPDMEQRLREACLNCEAPRPAVDD
jgi:hypothetical protein